MARIRTIKPEFPQSESMGRVSRDARLLFVLMWTLSDDEGRGRGASKFLASTLYPYDDDAVTLIDTWLDELEREGCIVRYSIDNSTYFQILGWRSHQKIDKPTPSRLPSPIGIISSNRSERDVELRLYSAIDAGRKLFGHDIVDVRRQVRVGSRYLDIVAKSETATFVLELKKTPIAKADLEQVQGYCALVGGIPVLVGPSISPQFNMAECKAAGCAIVTFDDDLRLSLSLTSEHASVCDVTLYNITERQALDLVPGPRTKDQGGEGGAIATPEGSFEDFWNAFPNQTGEQAAKAAHQRATADTEPSLILAGARRYRAAVRRDKTEPRFIKSPAKWLDERRWTDGGGNGPQAASAFNSPEEVAAQKAMMEKHYGQA